MNSDGFSIFFVMQESRFSKKGYIYSRQISLLDPKGFLDQFDCRSVYLAGGYCFVINKQIWNASKSTVYDPHEVYCDVDTLDYGLTFLQSVVEYLPSEKKVECSLLEMVIVKLRYKDNRTLSLVGEAASGSVFYKGISVEASSFFKALSDATDEYIRFAQALSERSDRSELLRERTRRTLLRKLQLPEWVAAADRLRHIIADIKLT